MKKTIYVLILTLLSLFIISCKSKQKNYNVDIMLCVSPNDGKLPDSVHELLLPFNLGQDTIRLFQGWVFNTSGNISYVKQKNWLEKLRGNITKNTTLALLREKINNH